MSLTVLQRYYKYTYKDEWLQVWWLVCFFEFVLKRAACQIELVLAYTANPIPFSYSVFQPPGHFRGTTDSTVTKYNVVIISSKEIGIGRLDEKNSYTILEKITKEHLHNKRTLTEKSSVGNMYLTRISHLQKFRLLNTLEAIHKYYCK